MITRTQLKKELVAERKRMREKQGESVFMSRTRNIFRSQEKRAKELKMEFPLVLETLRVWAREQLRLGCTYCRIPLTAKKFCVDHWYPIASGGNFHIHNVRLCCPSCNWQKGMMNGEQFRALRRWMDEHLAEPEKTDFKRRLTTGGRWTPRNY